MNLKTLSVCRSLLSDSGSDFLADGKEIGTQEIKYGESTERINHPKIPEKDDCFGKWRTPDAQAITENIDIECEYKNYITVLSGVYKNESGKLSLALAGGKFTDEAQLYVTENSQI